MERIDNMLLYTAQIENISGTINELEINCIRTIVNATGTPIIKGFKFEFGGTQNNNTSFVIYNVGTSPLVFVHNSVDASTGNKIECFNNVDSTLYPFEHADIIYDNSNGVFRLFLPSDLYSNTLRFPLSGILSWNSSSTVDTDGDWRMRVDAGSLVREKRIAGVWTQIAADSV